MEREMLSMGLVCLQRQNPVKSRVEKLFKTAVCLQKEDS